jgi:hypothetical protein
MPDFIGSVRDVVISEQDCLAWHVEFGENAMVHNDAPYAAPEGCPRRGAVPFRPKTTRALGFRTRGLEAGDLERILGMQTERVFRLSLFERRQPGSANAGFDRESE